MNKLNIVFLDIDGVLQPYNSSLRFYDLDRSIINKLSQKNGVNYSIYDYYDVTAVYYDWKEEAISRLKYILDKTNSKIIVSSNWRSEKYPNKMIDLLKIHNLDKYWYTDNIIKKGFPTIAEQRAFEIKHSLVTYPINNFVILDDETELYNYFPSNSVITHDYISIDNMNTAIKILKRN